MATRATAEPKRSAPVDSPAAAPSSYRESSRVRTALKVSAPGDSAEREADATARKVVAMRLPAIGPRVAERAPPTPARVPAVSIPRPTAPPPSTTPPPARPKDGTSPELEAAIRKELGGGKPLPKDVAEFMEPRFKANFANVRIHTDPRAENLATRLGAKAFTYGRDIFFNAGQFRSETSEGMELIAHELTHTIQQREVVQREAEAFAPVEVHETTVPHVQRGIISRALDWIADKANYIPGFRLFTVVIGLNPVNMSRVERSGANILRALIEFIPGGHLIVEALENHGVIQKGGKFIEDQFQQLGMVGGAFRDALMNFIDSLGWRDIFHLGDLWDRAKRIFTDPIGKLIDFGKGLVKGIAELVKDAIIKPLGAWAARNIPKWNLLVGVFGKNPISDDQESPASALIGAFMELIGQKEIWENIQKGGAVAKAWQWFQTAMKGALGLVLSIPGRVMDTIRSLTIFDIVTLVGAFRKIVGAFASFVGDFFKWAGGTVLSLLEIIFSVVAPQVMPYLKKAGGAFKAIIKAPGRFISTLVKAGKQGFNQFKAKFVTYLRDALFKWLLGGAEGAGVYFPKSFAPLELLKMGLSVLGLTWANIRGKLVAATNEATVRTFEAGFDIVKKLVTEGPAAAWEELLKNLSNLKTMVVDAAIDFVKGEVVKIAIEKLLSFLTPAGAFIQAIISIYRTIMFVVNKLGEIGRLVAAFIDGLAALANGIVTAAANKVESVLATGLSLAISFLANFAGLGNIPKQVMEIIKKIRDPVDKALDKVVAWIVDKAKKVGRSVLQAGVPADPNERLRLGMRASLALIRGRRGAVLSEGFINGALAAIKTRYGFSELTGFRRGNAWWLRGRINPADEKPFTDDQDLLRSIREIADAEMRRLSIGGTGAGTHESPRIVPAGGGIAAVGREIQALELGRGRKAVLDVTQGAETELRGGVQRPGFRAGGDLRATGATRDERSIRVGDYPAVAAAIATKFPDDRQAATDIRRVLAGGDIPARLRPHAGWIGGLKTLAGLEVARDPVALVTLPANLELVATGRSSMQEVFVQGGEFRGQTGTIGGRFSHSPVGAVAALRGVRADLAMPIDAGAPRSRGTAAERHGVARADVETIVAYARQRLGTKANPPVDEIRAVVQEAVTRFVRGTG
ncbi:MAG: DUF4157 domain-containing protein [Sphingomicrobium sp.]